jgi:hypothetical protein
MVMAVETERVPAVVAARAAVVVMVSSKHVI